MKTSPAFVSAYASQSAMLIDFHTGCEYISLVTRLCFGNRLSPCEGPSREGEGKPA